MLFVDTSVLCNLVDVPGRNQQRDEVMAEFRRLITEGTRFVIPVTAVVETGNHISQAAGDRRAAAATLVRFLEQAAASESPWQLHAVTWDARFLAALRAGGGTGQSLIDLLGSAQMGTGDVAILCERDEFRSRTNFREVGIWTLERILTSYS